MAFLLRPPHPDPLTHPPHASPSSSSYLLASSSPASSYLLQRLLQPLQAGARLIHGLYRRVAGNAVQVKFVERWQRAAPQPGGQVSAAVVGDPGAADVEIGELRQRFSLRRRHICRRRRHEGGEALVAEWVLCEVEMLQRRPPPQAWREGHQTRVADGGAGQPEYLKPRQGASIQGGSER